MGNGLGNWDSREIGNRRTVNGEVDKVFDA